MYKDNVSCLSCPLSSFSFIIHISDFIDVLFKNSFNKNFVLMKGLLALGHLYFDIEETKVVRNKF